mmetsp:Transcript_9948/g.23898  ORF Transcript_9948/g.23898 Transcript_9948/m.23898 type:complete len:352 (-) Transcript_9948:114-1169(-)
MLHSGQGTSTEPMSRRALACLSRQLVQYHPWRQERRTAVPGDTSSQQILQNSAPLLRCAEVGLGGAGIASPPPSSGPGATGAEDSMLRELRRCGVAGKRWPAVASSFVPAVLRRFRRSAASQQLGLGGAGGSSSSSCIAPRRQICGDRTGVTSAGWISPGLSSSEWGGDTRPAEEASEPEALETSPGQATRRCDLRVYTRKGVVMRFSTLGGLSGESSISKGASCTAQANSASAREARACSTSTAVLISSGVAGRAPRVAARTSSAVDTRRAALLSDGVLLRRPGANWDTTSPRAWRTLRLIRPIVGASRVSGRRRSLCSAAVALAAAAFAADSKAASTGSGPAARAARLP